MSLCPKPKNRAPGVRNRKPLSTPKSVADVRSYNRAGLLWRLNATQRAAARRVVQDRLGSLLSVYRFATQTQAYLAEKAELEALIYQSPLATLS